MATELGMNTAEDIVKEIGVRELAIRLGVGVTAVHNAKDSGVFPARYYRVISDHARILGRNPVEDSFLDLFAFATGERKKITDRAKQERE